MTKKTYTELCREAVELERQCKWSEAAELYVLASKRAKHPPARQAALAKADTAKRTAADHAELAGDPGEPKTPAVLDDAVTNTTGICACGKQKYSGAELCGKCRRAAEAVQAVKEKFGDALHKTLVDAGALPAAPATLAGPPEGAVEAAMPTVDDIAPMLPAAEPSMPSAAEQTIDGIPPTNPLPAPTASSSMCEAHGFFAGKKCPTCTAEDIATRVEELMNQDKTTNKETTTMATTTTEKPKMSDREALLAKKERVRMKQNKIEVGTELQHIRRGKTLARCTYAAERCFIFDGKQYSSLSDAGSAAAKKLGMKNPSVNGWLFWGIEKREA